MRITNAILSFAAMLSFAAVNFCTCYAMTDNDTSYRPFVEDGKSWVVISSYWYPVMAERYYIDGDTVIGSQQCKKLMLYVNNIKDNVRTTRLDRLIYEKDKKVYCYPAGDDSIINQPVLLYDFSAGPGDTLSLVGIDDAEMSETRIFQIWETPKLNWQGESFSGQLATYYNPELTEQDVETANCPLFCWYESIGSTFHPFTKLRIDWVGIPELLRDCRVGNRVIYANWSLCPQFPDFTGDALVDIADVNALISSMLYISDNTMFELTGDHTVDIADVNAIINVMLGKQ